MKENQYITQAELENGILVDASYPIGAVVQTQWGLKRVVRHVRVAVGLEANDAEVAGRVE